MTEDDIIVRIQSSRKELLELGLRNPMLNFRPSRRSIEIIHEHADHILAMLCSQAKAMTFEPAPESVLTDPLLPTAEPSVSVPAFNPTALIDNKLQTNLSAEHLFTTLLRIHTEAELFIQEQGVNALFLTLGCIYWFEDDQATTQRVAPLLMIPVSLKRYEARSMFRLEYTNDDVMDNLSLQKKLETDFGIILPSYAQKRTPDAEEELPSFNDFIIRVSKAIRPQSRWSVRADTIQLGFFSFGKFLMFRDLDPDNWPAHHSLAHHPIMRQLLGDGFIHQPALYADNIHIDTVLDPADCHFVADADSSQTLAILEARAGRSMIIQGPPGTGKSQTITNIIAELLGQGKTVLFVAEKMVALEVVKRRLDQAHLGDAVLELHSHKATKQVVLQEISRTLSRERPSFSDHARTVEYLKKVRDELNTYCEAVNTPIGSHTFIDVLGRYLALKRQFPQLQPWTISAIQNSDHEQYLYLRSIVKDLVAHLDSTGKPSANPFWGTRHTSLEPLVVKDIEETLTQTLAAVEQAETIGEWLASLLGTEAPTWQNLRQYNRNAQRISTRPALSYVNVDSTRWYHAQTELRSLIEAGLRLHQTYIQYGSLITPTGWQQDVTREQQYLSTRPKTWWRVLSPDYQQIRIYLQHMLTQPLPNDPQHWLAIIEAIQSSQRDRATIAEHSALGLALFGAAWHDENTDWNWARTISEWLITLHKDIAHGDVPAHVTTLLDLDNATMGRFRDEMVTLDQILQRVGTTLDGILDQLELQAVHQDDPIEDWPLKRVRLRLRYWHDRIDTLYAAMRFNVLVAELEQVGLGVIANHAAQGTLQGADILHTFDLTWLTCMISQTYTQQPILRLFDDVKQLERVQNFRHYDREAIKQEQFRLAEQVWSRMPSRYQQGEMGILRHELDKKRRHKPLRKLITEAGRIIQQIKPVFMMSPMSIARFLPPGEINFDVVIFDEASQVKTVDAFGAILRAQQVLVVGDSRQLPPTDFFTSQSELDDDDNITGDIESILGFMRVRGAQERDLRWHYRSRHESLIALSNQAFYDNRLIIFPSPYTTKDAIGLTHHYLPTAVYDRGQSRTNRAEAAAIARAVLNHALQRPTSSLGVVALSVAQRDMIQLELERLRRSSPQLNTFLLASSTEPFFIKNLEHVQGDERDVIMISIGYGRTSDGRISRSFGPINHNGGERRLNVLITRARQAMEVFSNFQADELVLHADSKQGLRVLKQFLTYAERGQLALPLETDRTADSPFESEVAAALRDRGYQIEQQVGSAGYFIDLAVRDPALPGRYLLAIECDGAQYHSARSARDRDRLRQSILEGLGWRFHRIWSTNWFQDAENELDRVCVTIKRVQEDVHATLRHHHTQKLPADVLQQSDDSSIRLGPSVGSTAEVLDMVQQNSTLSTLATRVRPYQKCDLSSVLTQIDLLATTPSQLADYIKLITDVEAPIHEADVIRRLINAIDVRRAGARIMAHVEAAIEIGVKRNLFFAADRFLYTDEQRQVALRTRADRSIDRIAPEELDAALLEIVRPGCSIENSGAIDQALEMLGFHRLTSRMKQQMRERIDHLVTQSLLVSDGTRLKRLQM